MRAHVLWLATFALGGCLRAPDFRGVGEDAPDAGVDRGAISVLALSAAGPVDDARIVVIGPAFRAVARTDGAGTAVIPDVPAGSEVWVEIADAATNRFAVTMIAAVQPRDQLVVGVPVAPLITSAARLKLPALVGGTGYRAVTRCYGYLDEELVTGAPTTVLLTRTNTCDTGEHKVLAAVTDMNGKRRSIVKAGLTNAMDEIMLSSETWLPDASFTHTVLDVPDEVRGVYGRAAPVIEGVQLEAIASLTASGPDPLGAPSGPMEVVAAADAYDLVYLTELARADRLEQYIVHRITTPSTDVADRLEPAPWIGPPVAMAGAIAWETDGGTHHLQIIDGVTMRPADNAQLRYRYIVPATEATTFSVPPLPDEMLDAAASGAVSYRVNLLRFDDDTTYDDVRENADVNLPPDMNYGTRFLGAERRVPKSPISRVAQSGVNIF